MCGKKCGPVQRGSPLTFARQTRSAMSGFGEERLATACLSMLLPDKLDQSHFQQTRLHRTTKFLLPDLPEYRLVTVTKRATMPCIFLLYPITRCNRPISLATDANEARSTLMLHAGKVMFPNNSEASRSNLKKTASPQIFLSGFPCAIICKTPNVIFLSQTCLIHKKQEEAGKGMGNEKGKMYKEEKGDLLIIAQVAAHDRLLLPLSLHISGSDNSLLSKWTMFAFSPWQLNLSPPAEALNDFCPPSIIRPILA
ncbi:hypothetical protein J6590_019651 [Homalodisca vitripennis]|nr:hypothetical protein J6590_019651 [Homalodisca vitripennis]